MAHCSMMERNTNTVEPMSSLFASPYHLHSSPFQDKIDILSTRASSLLSQYRKMKKRLFIKTINRRYLYEELMRKRLKQPYLQLIAVHNIMTGPERYTDNQLLPILKPLNEYNLKHQSVHNAVRVMFADNTPEEAYDIIHSVYGRFPDIRSSLLLSYSIVLLRDIRIYTPTKKNIKDAVYLVETVFVNFGKVNENILGEYERLIRELLDNPGLQHLAVHYIMTGPDRYTDDQLLEPLNKSDLQHYLAHKAVRVMLTEYTPEKAYDVIHSVYGAFPNIMDSLLLTYSQVVLDDKLSTISDIPTGREMKDVATLVKAVVIGIGKANKNFLDKLCNYIMYYKFKWIFLVIYHELFTLHHSLSRVDTLLHYMQRWIMAKEDRNWWNNKIASVYIETCFDLQEQSPSQCVSSIKEMFGFSPSLLCIIEQTFVHSHKYLIKEMLLTLLNNNMYIQEDVIALLPQDDLVNILAWTKKHKFNCKERDVAMLILQLNMTILEDTLKENLTSSIAAYLHISSNTGHDDIIYQCYCCVRHHNKKNHVDDDAIHEYQEQFPFIAAMEVKEKMAKLSRLITIVVLLILLLISSALGLTSSQLKKYLALKYAYEDSILYLLWCSGDVEINPGPTLKKLKKVPDSQKERSWIYDTSSVVVKTIHGHDLKAKNDGLWKEPLQNWDTRQPFYDPRNKPRGSNYSSKDDILLLQNLIDFLNQAGKQLPQPLEEEVMLWRNENKQELLKHYVLRTEKKVITKAMGVLSLYSDDKSLKYQLKEKKKDIVLPGQAGSNTTIKNYPDVVRDIATTICRVSKGLPITEKSDGIWKSPPLGWNSQDKYYSPCNAGKRNETDQDKQLVNNLINCCECQKIEIPSELEPMVKAWRSGNRDEVYKEYSIWANVCIIEHSLKYMEVEGLLDKPQVQQLLQELGISVSTDTARVNPSTLNDKPATKKRKRNATVTVYEGPKKKSAISNTVIALPACDKGHETRCDPTTTQTPNKNKDDETDNGLPADTTLVSHSANDKTQTNPNNLSDDDKNTNLGNQSRTRINDSSRLPSEVNSGRNLDGSAVPHDNTSSSDGAQIVMDTVDTSENVTMDTSEQDVMDTEDPDRLQKELDDLNDNPPPDLDFVEKYLTLLRNCDSCNNEFDLLTEVPSKESC